MLWVYALCNSWGINVGVDAATFVFKEFGRISTMLSFTRRTSRNGPPRYLFD